MQPLIRSIVPKQDYWIFILTNKSQLKVIGVNLHEANIEKMHN